MKKSQKITKVKKAVCDIFLCKKNLQRDTLIITTISIGLLILLTINHRQLSQKQTPEILPQPLAEKEENQAESPTIDTTNWKTYQSAWYGFELKYPDNWNNPQFKNYTKGVKWEYRYQFRKQEITENNPYIGFDVVVYNIHRIKELSNTDEFPTIKNEVLKKQGACQIIEGHLGENENYPAEQIYIDAHDDCYDPAYFYTLTRDNYMYNIVPILLGEKEKTIQSEKEIIENLPEFISASSTFDLIEIKRPKVIPKKTIDAPMPAWFKKDSLDRLVCAKDNDRPAKSDKGKKKHLDMECCLDPDEYPNPHCHYPKDKYGKYL